MFVVRGSQNIFALSLLVLSLVAGCFGLGTRREGKAKKCLGLLVTNGHPCAGAMLPVFNATAPTAIPSLQGKIAFTPDELNELVRVTAEKAVHSAAEEQRIFITSVLAQFQASFSESLEAVAKTLTSLKEEVSALRVEINSLKSAQSQVQGSIPRKETWAEKVAKAPPQGAIHPKQPGAEWTQVKSKKIAQTGPLGNPLFVDDDQMGDFRPSEPKATAKQKSDAKPKAPKARKIGSTRDVVTLPEVEVCQESVPSCGPLPEDTAQLLPGEFRPRPPRQFAPKAVILECVPHHSQMTYKDWRQKVAAAPGVASGNLLSMRRQGPHTLVVVYDGAAEAPVLAALRGLNRLTSPWRPKKEELSWVKSWIAAENHRATTALLEKVVQTLEKVA